ncbi:MAG: HAD family hydrolase, partial [Pseudomonadota bacterium]
MAEIDCIVWDFDGVLNANMKDGRFIWADTAAQDIGHNVEAFLEEVFTDSFDRIITGEVDLLEPIRAWANREGFAPGADYFLNYWFEKDALPDPRVIEIMDAAAAAGLRQVIATNNETRRSAYIENEMGFAARIERLFSSGRLGVAKPDLAFFRQVESALETMPERMIM